VLIEWEVDGFDLLSSHEVQIGDLRNNVDGSSRELIPKNRETLRSELWLAHRCTPLFVIGRWGAETERPKEVDLKDSE